MYTIVLFLHSWIRWIALVAAVGTTLAAVRRRDTVADRWSVFAVAALDLQMLLGLLLYFAVSPNMREILAHFGDSMKDPVARFWAVEHITAMFAAVAAAHVGRVLARKARTPEAKRMRMLICFGVATVLMLIGMPWPDRPAGRPYFRGL
jgi:heme A synthase